MKRLSIEDKDERIRKELIAFLKENLETGAADETWSISGLERWIDWLEKQVEQKLEDRAEPKFHEGEWLVQNERKNLIKVVNATPLVYKVVDIFGYHHTITDTAIENNYHLWTVQDAKEGDVLVCIGKHGQEIGIIKEYVGKYGGCDKCFETYCFVDWDGIFRTSEYMGSKEIHPATKEQRDTLKKAMANARYTFDFEKKELKKIEQKPAEEYNITGIGSKNAQGKLGEIIKNLKLAKRNYLLN